MFDGNRDCSICRKELMEGEKNFGVSLSGFTYVFCNGCFRGRREEVRQLLHGPSSSRNP